MNRTFKVGDRACHLGHGWGKVVGLMGDDRARVKFRDSTRVMFLTELLMDHPPRWSDVRPRDTVEFEVQGDTLKVKAQGDETQATVLGWRTTEVDGIWDLISIKKRNPPIPTHFGARVMYHDKQWSLIYASMLPNLRGTKHHMVWVEISEHTFNWVGHQDIDRETFEVIFEGWKTT